MQVFNTDINEKRADENGKSLIAGHNFFKALQMTLPGCKVAVPAEALRGLTAIVDKLAGVKTYLRVAGEQAEIEKAVIGAAGVVKTEFMLF